MLGGQIQGGTVTTTAGNALIGSTTGGSVVNLDGFNGTMDLTGSGVVLGVVGNLPITGNVLVGSSGSNSSSSRLEFYGNDLLSGNATILFNNSIAPGLRVFDNGATLTIGSG